MSPQFDPPYRDLTFMSPLSAARAEGLAAFLADSPKGTVVDIGCGWAELLMQTVSRSDSRQGIGIDLDEDSIAHGRELASERGLADRVTLLVGDGRTPVTDDASALIAIGCSQIWRRDTDADRLPYVSALEGLRAQVDRGARVVYGDGIWTVPPTSEATAALGGRVDEMVDLATLVEYADAAGFAPVAVGEADRNEWDQFESGFSACYARWLAAHPRDHPDAAEVRAIARRQRDGYLRGYRGVLGLAYLQLIAV